MGLTALPKPLTAFQRAASWQRRIEKERGKEGRGKGKGWERSATSFFTI